MKYFHPYLYQKNYTFIHHKLTLLFQNGQKIKNFISIFQGTAPFSTNALCNNVPFRGDPMCDTYFESLGANVTLGTTDVNK